MKKEVEIFNEMFKQFQNDCSSKIMASKNLFTNQSNYNEWYKERMFLFAEEYKEKTK